MGWGGVGWAWGGVAWRGKVWYGMEGYHLSILPLPFFVLKFMRITNYIQIFSFLIQTHSYWSKADSRLIPKAYSDFSIPVGNL